MKLRENLGFHSSAPIIHQWHKKYMKRKTDITRVDLEPISVNLKITGCKMAERIYDFKLRCKDKPNILMMLFALRTH